MTLGIALLLIFVLYLIDKHDRWWTAAKISLGMIALVVLALGVGWGWSDYSDYKTEKAACTALGDVNGINYNALQEAATASDAPVCHSQKGGR
jgi:predicted negative regulator of RcsB-dependent stress response